ncbi:hypothetical protein ACFR97_14365 [Haloplanus litoreus]|uniref:Ig-like domain-containing protein n=1 Tax=Haloplanus litoreus TaxID=767515 RepID=A0ABD5ZXM1_9EURY
MTAPRRSDDVDRGGTADRRTVLAVGAMALSVTTAGCVTPPRDSGGTASNATETATSGVTPTPTRSATPGPDPILVVVSNGRDVAVDVTLTVTRDGTPVFGDTVIVDPNSRRTVDPGIDATGTYELTVTLADGTEHVRPFSVEEYDLRMGSNLIVTVGERIRVVMEE